MHVHMPGMVLFGQHDNYQEIPSSVDKPGGICKQNDDVPTANFYILTVIVI